MRTVMAGKIKEGRVLIISAIEGAGKTKEAVKLIRKMGADRTAVVVIPSENPGLRLAMRNIAGIQVEPANALSVYDVIKYSHVILVGDSLAQLVKRCGGEA
jgi:large subunit ribosomal protein L4